MSRNDIILAGIDRGMRIIEIGPSHSPIAPKADGWNTCVVDHASTEDLIEKFRGTAGADLARIEHVDVVWNGGPLDQAVPADRLGTFDACVMSHVLEHIPDPIGFLKSLEQVLTPQGLVTIAYPDKRMCFDFFKPLSSTGELLEAHARAATRHSRADLFDFLAYNVYADGDHAWARRPIGTFTFYDSLGAAKAAYDAYAGNGAPEYADCHAWHFTPSSFELALLELATLGEIDFTIARQHPTVGAEFYVTLQRCACPPVSEDVLDSRRLVLMRQTLAEIRDQSECLAGGAAAELGRQVSARDEAVPAPSDWPQDTWRLRARLARYLTGDGIDVGPGPHPFPVPYPGACILRVDRWQPEENTDLYPELADESFPEPDVVCDLNEEHLSAFGDGKLDFVVASHVLEHVADPLGLLDDMHRVLRPDGIALILLPDRRLTFDRNRPATRLDVLVRKHAQRVTAVGDDDIDEFLESADPEAFAALRAAEPETRSEIYDWHRRRSIHVHCWTEEEFTEVLEHGIRTLGHAWDLLDAVVAADEGHNGFEFGFVLRKSTATLEPEALAERFAATWNDWIGDRHRLHAYIAALLADQGVEAEEALTLRSELAAARAELHAFRTRRAVRATDRAAGLIRHVKARRAPRPGSPA
jgi:SAM-dependent methyltransferase